MIKRSRDVLLNISKDYEHCKTGMLCKMIDDIDHKMSYLDMSQVDVLKEYSGCQLNILIVTFIKYNIALRNKKNIIDIINNYTTEVKYLIDKNTISLDANAIYQFVANPYDSISDEKTAKFMYAVEKLSFDKFIESLKLSDMDEDIKVKCISKFIKSNGVPENVESKVANFSNVEKLYHSGALKLTDAAFDVYDDKLLEKIINH